MSYSRYWTRSDILTLINFYKENTFLWDGSNKDFCNRKKRQDVLEMIGKSMARSVKELKTKIHGLRNQMLAEMKKTQIRKRGSPSYESKWEFYNALSFLKDTFLSAYTFQHFLEMRNIPPTQTPIKVDIKENEKIIPQTQIHHRLFSNENGVNRLTSGTPNRSDVSENGSNITMTIPCTSNQRFEFSDTRTTNQLNASDAVKSRKSRRKKHSKPKEIYDSTDDDHGADLATKFLSQACSTLQMASDEYSVFSEFMGIQIRQLKNENMRRKAIRKIQELLFTISDEDNAISEGQHSGNSS